MVLTCFFFTKHDNSAFFVDPHLDSLTRYGIILRKGIASDILPHGP